MLGLGKGGILRREMCFKLRRPRDHRPAFLKFNNPRMYGAAIFSSSSVGLKTLVEVRVPNQELTRTETCHITLTPINDPHSPPTPGAQLSGAPDSTGTA